MQPRDEFEWQIKVQTEITSVNNPHTRHVLHLEQHALHLNKASAHNSIFERAGRSYEHHFKCYPQRQAISFSSISSDIQSVSIYCNMFNDFKCHAHFQPIQIMNSAVCNKTLVNRKPPICILFPSQEEVYLIWAKDIARATPSAPYGHVLRKTIRLQRRCPLTLPWQCRARE